MILKRRFSIRIARIHPPDHAPPDPASLFFPALAIRDGCDTGVSVRAAILQFCLLVSRSRCIIARNADKWEQRESQCELSLLLPYLSKHRGARSRIYPGHNSRFAIATLIALT